MKIRKRRKIQEVNSSEPFLFIQCTGTHSTGKTTLITELYNLYSKREDLEVVLLSSVSRKLLSNNLISGVDIDASDIDQLRMSSESLLQRFQAVSSSIQSNKKTLILSDRSPMCDLAYTQLLSNVSAFTLYLAAEAVKVLKEVIFTVYLPPVIEFSDDGVRKSKSRFLVDQKILQILEEFNISFLELREISLISRKERLSSIINSYFNF